MSATYGYPLKVQGRLDPHLSRWLWLVKWLLAIPHYVVLAFLWVTFGILSIVAFVAILFTGRYPRAIFDFNVGVLRWSWRVAYYSYWALGTDRYPPFTLAEVPDYPATLTVDYPQRLSRGLVLVKWLLVLPHLLVVAVFAGGGLWLAGGAADEWRVEYPGLIGLLTFVAATMLAATGRYPRGLFDLLLGLNRWVLRVAAYAALMTDTYPPFRMDQGGDDSGAITLNRDAQGTTSDAGTSGDSTGRPATMLPESAPQRPWTAGRIVALVVGVLLACGAAGMGVAGAAALAVDRFGRDDDGFIATNTESFTTDRYALETTAVEIRNDGPDWVLGEDVVGDVRLRVEPTNAKEVFLGVAERSAVDTYLAGVSRDVISDTDGDEPTYRPRPGGAPEDPPQNSDIWVASASGFGEQTVALPVREGDWVVVVINSDGSAGVSVEGDVAAELPALPWVAGGLLVGGVVLAGAGAVSLYLSLRS